MYENRETTSHGVLWDTLRCNQNRIGSSEYSSYPATLISEASRASEGITGAKNMKVHKTNWVPRQQSDSGKRRNKWNKWIGSGLALLLLAVAAQELATRLSATHAVTHSIAAPPVVTVSAPLAHNLDTRRQFLGQFSAVQSVELRSQVGGTLTQIGFKDRAIVHKGYLLFEIDPTPYQIKLNEAIPQLQNANARLELATRELNRANELRLKNVIPPQDLHQRAAEKQAAEAAVDNAKAAIA